MKSIAATLALLAAVTVHATEPGDEIPESCSVAPIATPAADPPYEFWAKHPEGQTIVAFQFHVGAAGSVDEIRFTPGDHHPDFEREVTDALRTWSFDVRGCPDGAWRQSTMTFVAPE